jgi:hypothetical protein
VTENLEKLCKFFGMNRALEVTARHRGAAATRNSISTKKYQKMKEILGNVYEGYSMV